MISLYALFFSQFLVNIGLAVGLSVGLFFLVCVIIPICGFGVAYCLHVSRGQNNRHIYNRHVRTPVIRAQTVTPPQEMNSVPQTYPEVTPATPPLPFNAPAYKRAPEQYSYHEPDRLPVPMESPPPYPGTGYPTASSNAQSSFWVVPQSPPAYPTEVSANVNAVYMCVIFSR